jgi:hypothetical protein
LADFLPVSERGEVYRLKGANYIQLFPARKKKILPFIKTRASVQAPNVFTFRRAPSSTSNAALKDLFSGCG